MGKLRLKSLRTTVRQSMDPQLGRVSPQWVLNKDVVNEKEVGREALQ